MDNTSEIYSRRNKHTVVIITGEKRELASKVFSYLLKKNGRKEGVSVFEANYDRMPSKESLFRENQGSLLIISSVRDEDVSKVLDFIKALPQNVKLVFCYDQEALKKIFDLSGADTLTFGFQEGANLRASDLNQNGKTNFKIHYKGNVIPFWINSAPDKKSLYAVLAAVSAVLIVGINPLQISQSLQSYS